MLENQRDTCPIAGDADVEERKLATAVFDAYRGI